MARDRSPAVGVMVPSVNILSVETGKTPLPICRPVGAEVAWVLPPPGRRMVVYISSAKSTWDFLKPVVSALARLLAMVSMRNVCASIPVAAVCIAFIVCAPCSCRRLD